MFKHGFKNVERVVRTATGSASALDDAERSNCLSCHEYLGDSDVAQEDETELEGGEYQPILDRGYRWGVWAAPKQDHSEIDHQIAMTGQELIDRFRSGFVWGPPSNIAGFLPHSNVS